MRPHSQRHLIPPERRGSRKIEPADSPSRVLMIAGFFGVALVCFVVTLVLTKEFVEAVAGYAEQQAEFEAPALPERLRAPASWKVEQ